MPQSKRPLLVGITGNIGSGKSTFCQSLIEQGIAVYFADTIANQRLEDPKIVDTLVQHFSESILSGYLHCGLIDRKKLAEIVFHKAEELKFLNALIHPKVLMDLQEIVENSTEQLICIEVPLLFEVGLQNCFDFLVLICAPETLRLERLKSRCEPEAELKKRMQAQMDDAVKRDKVDCVVENNGSPEDLDFAATKLLTRLSEATKKQVKPFYEDKAQ
ncbi:MAG: dephospho-CoA kinase [Candidatus Cloacimonas sp.]|jgi:dephospho-CoA kinase|nr:dephospho-CoA kinase [Candidatus Cloacimonas sp.]